MAELHYILLYLHAICAPELCIKKVIIGENKTFTGPEDYLRSRGAEVIIIDDEECCKLM
jgi:hypothetical protein